LVRAEANPEPTTPAAAFYKDDVVDPFAVAEMALTAVRCNRLHVFTHASSIREVEGRHRHLLDGFRDLLGADLGTPGR